jgi:two-component system, NarL family, nitrate/nitrite response regulator NarL
MPSAKYVLVNFGLDRLFYEIVAAAMSQHGWRVPEFEQDQSHSEDAADVVLVFAYGESESVLKAIGSARAEFPGAKVVLLGTEISDSDVIRYIEGGVNAYVLSTQSLADLVSTIQMVHNNQTPASGRVTQLVLGKIGRLTRQRDTAPETKLTQREVEILQLVGAGFGNKEIASHLGIAANTVKNHVHHILEKLKVKNRHEASWIRSRLRAGFPIAG